MTPVQLELKPKHEAREWVSCPICQVQHPKGQDSPSFHGRTKLGRRCPLRPKSEVK